MTKQYSTEGPRAIYPELCTSRRRHRLAFPPVKAPWFVFRRPDGAPLAPDWILRRWHLALEAAGLPSIPFHATRHSAAALMLDDSGGDLRMVSQALGHGNIGTTVDRYGGLATRAMQKAADAMDRMLEADEKTG